MANKPPATVEGIKDGLTKLLREIELIKTEIAAITSKLANFKETETTHKRYDWDPDGPAYGQRQTREPLSAIRETLLNLEDENLEPASRALMAVFRDLDGALRDIRRARNDIEAIAGDSDRRDGFKKRLRRR